ncbi:recombinase family protein [Nostoc sp. CHAB 5834]|nr:recombinase family protein [Nostoc sp. CHAB 5834]
MQAAIQTTKQYGSRLLIAKLDRLSRNVSFVMDMQDSEVDFVACDLLNANTLTIGSFAQHEAESIFRRTRATLAQTKARGFRLGKPENFTDSHRAQGVAMIKNNALIQPANRQAGELIRLCQRDGLSLRATAERLNAHGFRTRYGRCFQSETVRRM